MKKVISEDMRAELQALAKLTDEQIDTSDIPEQRDWKGAKRGLFYRPIKQQLTLRIDSDIIAWFKSRVAEGEGYQTRINSALRAYVEQHEGK
jgi:uncharacterized protein (DUF4415 family)